MYTQDGESKYVANILSSMASGGETIAVTTYAVPSTSYLSGIPSATTSSLTPTTLASLEQTFIELQSVPVNSTPSRMTQSGFVPPIVDPIISEQYSDSSSDPEWTPAAKRFKMGVDGVSSTSEFDPSITNPARKTHRRSLRDEKLTPEEEERRRVRRERNKVAAAKCRQRRVDHTNVLITETEKLESEQNDLENEIQSLQQQKDQLEFILQAHQPVCKVNGANPAKVKVKAEPVEDLRICKDTAKTLELTLTTAAAATTTTASSSASSRPSTLSLVKKEVATTDIPPTSAISLTTPSNGFYSFSLDTMVDHTGLTPLTGGGHTGLTPLTNGPTTCSSEVPRSSSESSDNATLISL